MLLLEFFAYTKVWFNSLENPDDEPDGGSGAGNVAELEEITVLTVFDGWTSCVELEIKNDGSGNDMGPLIVDLYAYRTFHLGWTGENPTDPGMMIQLPNGRGGAALSITYDIELGRIEPRHVNVPDAAGNAQPFARSNGTLGHTPDTGYTSAPGTIAAASLDNWAHATRAGSGQIDVNISQAITPRLRENKPDPDHEPAL